MSRRSHPSRRTRRSAADTPAAEPAPARPRIGLALSGGGARGAAHIGVLKVLEELRIPVHCVTGTSMGSIVGGAYAAGMPARRARGDRTQTDWDEVFSDRPPRGEIASRRKADDYKTLFAPSSASRTDRCACRKGLIAGVSIESFLRTLTESASAINDFQKLPIPFRAVAADIETGEAVVLERGSVPQAMRASMAIPGVVSPVEIDGRLLVDGGIANNLPIDVVRKLCADVVIAVNISTPALKRDEITSALTVVTQLVNFLGKSTVDRQLASLGPRDVLIAPELGDICAGSFEQAAEAIDIGEAAARRLCADQLTRYSVSEQEYAALRARRSPSDKQLGPWTRFASRVSQRTNAEVLRALVQSKPGEPLTEEKIAADLRRIYGRGDFESVDYRHLRRSPENAS